MFGILKKRKQQKIAFENGKQVLVYRGVLAWQAYQTFKEKGDEESQRTFKSLMKTFYFGKLIDGLDFKSIIYIPYASIAASKKRVAKQINKALASRGVEVKELLSAYKDEIIETEMCYGY